MKIHRSPRFHRPFELAAVLLSLIIVFGVMWDWVAALVVAIGGILLIICYYITLGRRTSLHFYDFSDHDKFTFFQDVVPRVNVPQQQEQDTDPIMLNIETEQEIEDRRVRAILSQVTFPDDDF